VCRKIAAAAKSIARMRSTAETLGDKVLSNCNKINHIRQKKARIANVGARFIVAPF
jgi:hypothetical protein